MVLIEGELLSFVFEINDSFAASRVIIIREGSLGIKRKNLSTQLKETGKTHFDIMISMGYYFR